MQQKIMALKSILGMQPGDEQLIARHSDFLLQQQPDFNRHVNQWIRQHQLLSGHDSDELFQDNFFRCLVSGRYDEHFYICLHRQTLHWYHLGLSERDALLLLSQTWQQLSRYGQQLQNADLSHALCLVVDLCMNLVLGVYQLSHKMQDIRQKSEYEMRRIQQAFSLLSTRLPQNLVQAYANHQQWKFLALSLALGNPLNEQQDLAPISRCHLTHWLSNGGSDIIDDRDLEAFHQAHRRVHELADIIREQALKQQPELIVGYLNDIESASDVVGSTLLECINRAISDLATHDSLTRQRNRTTLEALFQEKLAQARQSGRHMAIVLFDIDHFKSINDRYGHLAGDHILIEIARLLKQHIRIDDAVFRWGGEEFLVLGLSEPDTPHSMVSMAERIRTIIAATRFSTGEQTLALTVSAGVVEVPPRTDLPIHEIFAEADRLLYQAKQEGRNRICHSVL